MMSDDLRELVDRWRRAFNEVPPLLDARLMREILEAHEAGQPDDRC